MSKRTIDTVKYVYFLCELEFLNCYQSIIELHINTLTSMDN